MRVEKTNFRAAGTFRDAQKPTAITADGLRLSKSLFGCLGGPEPSE